MYFFTDFHFIDSTSYGKNQQERTLKKIIGLAHFRRSLFSSKKFPGEGMRVEEKIFFGENEMYPSLYKKVT
jgi:hypothetical protein